MSKRPKYGVITKPKRDKPRKKINQEKDLEDIKKEEINTKKEWVNIEKKGVDKRPTKSYTTLKLLGMSYKNCL